MMSDMTLQALMDSEVFRNFASEEIKKEQIKVEAEKKSLENVLSEFETFELRVKQSPEQLKVFQSLQKRFASDQTYTETIDPKFVEAVMLLDLDS
jgi:hypothetical protein